MKKSEIYEQIGKLVIEKAKIISAANTKAAEIDKKLNELGILADTIKDGE